MAKLERTLRGNFDEILGDIDNAVRSRSASATFEHQSDFSSGDARCSVRAYERYSMIGSNRLGMTVTLFGSGDKLFLSAITTGGSQAVLFKFNTFGEEAFLDTIRDVVKRYEVKY